MCILTEGMANVSDATDVTALALSRSDTIPAIMLPTWSNKLSLYLSHATILHVTMIKHVHFNVTILTDHCSNIKHRGESC